MSDLDADLYGDLYGNDEPLEELQDDAGAAQAHEHDQGSSEPHSHSTADSTLAPQPIPTVTSSTPASKSIPTHSGNSSAQYGGAPAATTLQKIPTYEESHDDSYRQSSGPPDSNYANAGLSERSVRPSEMKDEGKMFIGGLNWDTTDKGLKDYFSQFGKVDACTIMRDAAGRSRCFAFLTFEDPASVNAVMVREHTLDGKIIDPKRAIPRKEHQRATKLFIGGLPGSVTSETMREFFSQFGKVIDSTVMLDRETGRSKGFGFVSFEDTDVRPFLGFGNLEIDGKLIDVKLAQPRYQRDEFAENGGQEGGYTGGTGGAGGGGAAAGSGGAAGFAGGAQGNFGGMAGAGGNTPFDPQALAALYTRMFQMTGGMNPAMMGAMGGMNPMMAAAAGMGGPGGFAGGMRPGMMPNAGMAGMAGGMGGGMGRGAGAGVAGAGGVGPNVPRGPRVGSAGPVQHGGPAGGQGGGGGGAGMGPQRTGQRGAHNFHPYARPT